MKKILIVLSVLVAVGLVYAGIIWFKNRPESPAVTESEVPVLGGDKEQNMDFLGGAGGQVSLPAGSPAGDTFTISTPTGGIKVKNFYKTAVAVVEENQVVIFFSEKYELDYSIYDGSFDIVVRVEDQKTRLEAEKDLIDRLGISRADACRLTVSVSMPKADPAKLSFCGIFFK
ncbi:MAG: hypothetical protein LiPW15_748 [Parcubacteria group bacterium LiPW_15]|nr:MAG: hypothetical protein LiPW15_748 [Parcubacteria group bacterium LiPW_15]